VDEETETVHFTTSAIDNVVDKIINNPLKWWFNLPYEPVNKNRALAYS
jgi:hypothetical protein